MKRADAAPHRGAGATYKPGLLAREAVRRPVHVETVVSPVQSELLQPLLRLLSSSPEAQ